MIIVHLLVFECLHCTQIYLIVRINIIIIIILHYKMSVRLNKKREFSDFSDSSTEKSRLKKRKNLS